MAISRGIKVLFPNLSIPQLNRPGVGITPLAMDARGLSDFYDSEMGQRTRRLILARLKVFWPNVKGQRLLGYGFAAPYLGAFPAERAIAAMPAEMGAVNATS